MNVLGTLFFTLTTFVQRRFLFLLLAAYAAAAVWPAPGLWLRGVSFGELALFGASVRLSLPLVMLAVLLLVAGLGVRTDQLQRLVHRPLALGAGMTATVLVPLALLFGLSLTLRFWHDGAEAQSLLVGLAVVAAMPVAGSSAAWVQKADGDLPLSLGLVLGSTVISPWTTHFALQVIGMFADRSSAEILTGLANFGTGTFLVAGVIVPTLAGILGHAAAGEARITPVRPYLKLTSTLVLLLLCYTNAATSLPQAVAEHDWDFLALLLAAVLAMCVLTFAAGWALARLLRVGPAQRVSLVYGLGMSNNGTGLVLAATALGGYPRVLLPLIVYNLAQHLVAGVAGMYLKSQAEAESRAAATGPRPESAGNATRVSGTSRSEARMGS